MKTAIEQIREALAEEARLRDKCAVAKAARVEHSRLSDLHNRLHAYRNGMVTDLVWLLAKHAAECPCASSNPGGGDIVSVSLSQRSSS